LDDSVKIMAQRTFLLQRRRDALVELVDDWLRQQCPRPLGTFSQDDLLDSMPDHWVQAAWDKLRRSGG